MTVRSIRTGHLSGEKYNFPSFAFVLEAEGQRILHTGDLRGDFADFLWQECLPGTVCICELTHYELEPWIDQLADKAQFPCTIADDKEEFIL